MTRKPPKILTAAKIIAKNPKIFEPWKTDEEVSAKAAIIAALANVNEKIFETSNIFGYLAILLAAVNIFGGFLVTQRMLQMYKKKKK